MLTPKQRQQITDFCLEYEITRFWLLDRPLLNESILLPAGCPSAIVTFRPHWEAVPIQFARMEREVAQITGPETALYSTGGISPRLFKSVAAQAQLVFPAPDTPPATPDDIAALCREHHIAKMWLLDAPLPDGDREESGPSVIVKFHPDRGPGLEFYGIEKKVRTLFGPAAALYSTYAFQSGPKAEILKTAMVCYVDDAP